MEAYLSNHIGLDVGTTTITAIVVDGQTGDVISKATASNDAETTSVEDRKRGLSEWDVARTLGIARNVLAEAVKPVRFRRCHATVEPRGRARAGRTRSAASV